MVETIEIGSAPCYEQCAQVGETDYPERSRAECRAFANQIKRVLGEPPEGVSLFTKSSGHDFGTYREVVAKVGGSRNQAEHETALAYAYRCESDCPTNWDDAARAELAEAGFPARVEA